MPDITSKYVVVLGGNEECVFAMQSAKDLNLKLILVGIEPCNLALELADIFIKLDLKHTNEIIKALSQYQLLCVLPTPMGRILTCIGAINQAFNLPGPNAEQIDIFTDKLKFNQIFINKLNLASCYLVKSATDVKNIIANNQQFFPAGFILKPRYGSGSKGVKYFANFDLKHIEEYFLESKNSEIILENYIQGEAEYGLDAFISSDHINILSIRKKVLTALPNRQELKHHFNATSIKLNTKMQKNLQIIQDKIQLDNAFINMDFLLRDKQIYIIEASPRTGGNMLSETFCWTLGINPYREFLNLCLNKEFSFKPEQMTTSLLSFINFPAECWGKKVSRIGDFSDIAQLKLLDCNAKIGDIIQPITNGKEARQTGWFLLQGEEYEIDQAEQKIYTNFKFEE